MTQTAKQKAYELTKKFWSSSSPLNRISWYVATKLAIICVNEILEATKIEVDRPDAGCYTVYSQYWQSVLTELKAML